jgi:hypothetical protein
MMGGDSRDAKEYRDLRELLKARLRSERIGAPEEYLSETAAPLPGGFKTPEAQAQHENIPDKLRAEAEYHRREEAKRRALSEGHRRKADAHARAALEADEQARLATAAQAVVSFGPPKRRGMTIIAAPSDAELQRSADPDAVEREAVARTREAHTRPAAQGRRKLGDEARARVQALWPVVKAECEAGGRKTTKEEIADKIAKRLEISPRTVRTYKPE